MPTKTKKTKATNKLSTKPSGKGRFERVVKKRPTGNEKKHLYRVTLVVLADASEAPEFVIDQVMAACLHFKHPIAVVDGYGAKVENLTLKDPNTRGGPKGMICIGLDNKPLPKGEIPIIQPTGWGS